MMRYKEEKEAKKEAFRKYLESSGVLDALTKVLVSLYEQNEKPSSALDWKNLSTCIISHLLQKPPTARQPGMNFTTECGRELVQVAILNKLFKTSRNWVGTIIVPNYYGMLVEELN
ncbi:uncharacterized protein LOC8268198 isoform X2 [Ricinus communis]|uniref:uncharacterized protein LOC8268198 isoform X2 n=1 Tax=Ricinus communis TaxID=3988 RepID=UPI0007727FB0|nr:uncharacterized protein LOC8268198 isoform X2 [Ricinus communis]|eukprot:XP_015576534.1 uncharacterized protein LOC8268198 isoform X2 [Ricinus communis]